MVLPSGEAGRLSPSCPAGRACTRSNVGGAVVEALDVGVVPRRGQGGRLDAGKRLGLAREHDGVARMPGPGADAGGAGAGAGGAE